jgi:glutamine synthetase
VERGPKSVPSRLAAAERQYDLQGAALDYRSEAMVPNCATAEDLLKTIKDEKVQMIDLRFTDLPGVWQHFSVPPSAVNVDTLNEGIGFDGSSIRGFQEIQESDMLVVPDPTTAFLDPFASATTLS